MARKLRVEKLGVTMIGLVLILFFLLLVLLASETPSERIAIIEIDGEIASSSGLFGSVVTPDSMVPLFESAASDSSVKAIVVKINSPGGGVVETKEIARAMMAADKPTVAWIGSMGASGAYYIASFADIIVADSSSMVGSVGVISIIQEYEGLFEKLGINTTTITSAEFKDIGSPYREMTPAEIEQFQYIVDEVHKDFLGVITVNRGLSEEQALEVGTAKIFLGKDAVALGLVDTLGGFEDAVDTARTLCACPGAATFTMGEESLGLYDLTYAFGRGVGDSVSFEGSSIVLKA